MNNLKRVLIITVCNGAFLFGMERSFCALDGQYPSDLGLFGAIMESIGQQEKTMDALSAELAAVKIDSDVSESKCVNPLLHTIKGGIRKKNKMQLLQCPTCKFVTKNRKKMAIAYCLYQIIVVPVQKRISLE